MTIVTNAQPQPQTTPRDPDAIPLWEPIVEIVFTSIIMVLFNVMPEHIGVTVSAGEPASFVPLLSPVFFERYLPLLNLYWGLTIGLAIIHLTLTHWTIATRFADIGLNCFGLSIFTSMLFGPSIIALTQEMADSGSAWVQVAEALVNPLWWVVRWVLVIAIIGTAIDLIKRTLELVRAVTR